MVHLILGFLVFQDCQFLPVDAKQWMVYKLPELLKYWENWLRNSKVGSTLAGEHVAAPGNRKPKYRQSPASELQAPLQESRWEIH